MSDSLSPVTKIKNSKSLNPLLPQNIHTHTVFSDGKNSAEDMVKAAVEMGFESLGFTDHSPITVEGRYNERYDYTLGADEITAYIAEISRLKELYRGKIEIFTGIEDDYYPPMDKNLFDFVIGSVHFLKSPETGKLLSFDYTGEEFDLLISHYGGDVKDVVQDYFKSVVNMVKVHSPDIVAHFDLIVKLNKDNCYFDQYSGWYRDFALDAIDEIADLNASKEVIIEVNSGAISRGYTDVPYPDPFILKYMCHKGIPTIITSDCHDMRFLDCNFENSLLLVKKAGYKSVKRFKGKEKGFIDIEI